MKKVLSLILAVTTTIGMLAGCGAPAASSSAASSSAAEASSAAPAASGDAAASGTAIAKDPKDLKIGVVLSGSANDGGWSQMAASAAKEVADKYGCTVNYSEAVGATDTESTIRGYADAGYDIIVTHGAEYLDADKLVAPDYPNVRFICTSATSGQDPNLTGIDFATYELGFLCGAASAMVTKSKKIGAVGSNEIDSIVAWSNGVKDGAKYIDPACEVFSVYTGSYEDALKAKQSVDALVEKGVDVVTQNADASGIGAVQRSTELKLLNVGAVADQSQFGEACFLSVIQDARHGIVVAIDKAVKGELPTGFINMGAAADVIALSDFSGPNANVMSDEQKTKLKDIWTISYEGKPLQDLMK